MVLPQVRLSEPVGPRPPATLWFALRCVGLWGDANAPAVRSSHNTSNEPFPNQRGYDPIFRYCPVRTDLATLAPSTGYSLGLAQCVLTASVDRRQILLPAGNLLLPHSSVCCCLSFGSRALPYDWLTDDVRFTAQGLRYSIAHSNILREVIDVLTGCLFVAA